MAMAREQLEKGSKIPKLQSNTYHTVKKIVKIGPQDPEIIGLQGIIKKDN